MNEGGTPDNLKPFKKGEAATLAADRRRLRRY
jgi:hypothetical protein